MIFWIGILIGCILGWYAVKSGFFESFLMLFNIVISVYLAIFLGPIIVNQVPSAADIPCAKILAVFSTALGVLLILYLISISLILSDLQVTFPKVVDTLFSAIAGFLAGFLVWSFLALLIFMSPLSQNEIVKTLGFNAKGRQTVVSHMVWWCNRVHSFAGYENSNENPRQLVSSLLEVDENSSGASPADPNIPDSNSPAEQ